MKNDIASMDSNLNEISGVKLSDEKEEYVILNELEKEIASIDTEALFACESSKDNPFFFSIIAVNNKFCELFNLNKDFVIGKNYDFLFETIELDYSSQDQMEYTRLLKSVKSMTQCSIVVKLNNINYNISDVKVKIDFIPKNNISDSENNFAFFKFIKIEGFGKNSSKSLGNAFLLRNLERVIRNERVLREIDQQILSDMSVTEIGKYIAKIICSHLKVDRCIIHDYKDRNTTFVIEETLGNINKFIDEKNTISTNNIDKLKKYISFHTGSNLQYSNNKKRTKLASSENSIIDHNFKPIKNICEEFNIKSLISIQILIDAEINGAIYIHQKDTRKWLVDEIDLVEVIAEQFSIAVERSQSIEKLMITNHQLIEKTKQLKIALKEEKNIRKMQNEFVAIVSHEFKTPLQIIDSTRELLLRKLKSHNVNDESILKSFQKIKSGIQRMNGLIHSTLNLAKMENGKKNIKIEKADFNIREFIEEIVERNSSLTTVKNIKIDLNLNNLPETFYGDMKLLDHSFTNIISNAIKYSRDNTTIKIITKHNDKKIAIKVIDQGMGIPKDDLKNIGKKFFRASNTLSVAGTGIGLYLTKYFIELHNGSIIIDSIVNVGTSVLVVLPKISD